LTRLGGLIAIVSATAATAGGAIPSAGAAPRTPPLFGLQRCTDALQERTRTIIGTPGADELTGLEQDDVFDGGAGGDTLVGLAGDDCLYGITGRDVIFGLDDDDALVGGDGNDELVGGRGRDTLFGVDGNDRLWGGERTRGSRDAASCIRGGRGDDQIVADAARGGSCARRNRGATSSLDGGHGDDTIYARNRTRDFVQCGRGRDRAIVDRGDVIYASGRDRCERIIRKHRRRPARPSLGEELMAPGADTSRLSFALARRFQPILNGFRGDYPPTPFDIIGAAGYNNNKTCGREGDDDRFTMLSDKDDTEMVNLYKGGDQGATLRELGERARGPGNKTERYIDLPCGESEGDQREIFRAGFSNVGLRPTIYTDVAPDRRTGLVAISYWFWFTYNPGPPGAPGRSGAHEGDWEHLTVYLDRKGRPREVYYATHNEGQRRRWSPSTANPSSGKGLVSRRGTHVIGNIALGSHATFPDCVSTVQPGPRPDDVGCPGPQKGRLPIPAGSVQYGVGQTTLRTFGEWVCWRGRVGEETNVLRRGLVRVNAPQMPYLQDEVVRDGRLADLDCDAGGSARSQQSAAQARAAQPAELLPIPSAERSALPLADLGSCARTRPGPERGGIVVQVCTPALIRASFEDGLRPVAAARRRQPRIVGRTRREALDGRPVQTTLRGGPGRARLLVLRHADRRPVRARIDVVDWSGDDPLRSRSAALTLRLPRLARLSVTGSGLQVLAGGRVLGRASFRTTPVVEDP